MTRVQWPLTPIAELAAGVKWAINGGPFGSKLVSRDYVESGVPVIRGVNLPLSKRFHSDDFVFVSEEKADELLANTAHPGDVIITQRGTLGQVGIVPLNSAYPRYVISQSQMKITVDPARVDADWLYYCFRSPAHQNELINRASSSGVPHINLGVLRDFKVPLPDLQTQRGIASTLSAYDDLIENNTRRIAILEEIARRTYEEWFVHFRFPGHEQVRLIESELGLIPEGWRKARLGELSSYINRGIAPKYNDEAEGLVVNQKCIRDQRLSYVPARRQSKPIPADKRIRLGDVLINSTGVGTLGRVAQVLEELPHCTADSHVTIVRPNEEATLHFFGLTVLAKESYFEQQGVGSTGQTELSRSRVAETDAILPPRQLQQQFDEVVGPLRQLATVLSKKNIALRSARDLLLPKLMSGEIAASTMAEPEELIPA